MDYIGQIPSGGEGSIHSLESGGPMACFDEQNIEEVKPC